MRKTLCNRRDTGMPNCMTFSANDTTVIGAKMPARGQSVLDNCSDS